MVFVIILVFNCLGCTKQKIAKMVKNTIGQTVSYPSDLFYIEGADKRYVSLEHPEMTLLVWFDSTECSSCKLKGMSMFQGMMSYCRDTLGPIDIKFLFSPLPEKVDDIAEMALDMAIDYPIFIDVSNKFKEYNKFIPDHFNYHSFLLDKEGRIELIGNPLINEQINQLYRSTMKNNISDYRKE